MYVHDTKELNAILADFGISPILTGETMVEKVEIRDIRANENNWSIL